MTTKNKETTRTERIAITSTDNKDVQKEVIKEINKALDNGALNVSVYYGMTFKRLEDPQDTCRIVEATYDS